MVATPEMQSKWNMMHKANASKFHKIISVYKVFVIVSTAEGYETHAVL